MARSSTPRRWFYAVLDPDTDDPLAIAERATHAPGIVAARVHRRVHRGQQELWLVLHLEASSHDHASTLAHDALFPLIWPADRIASEFGTGAWVAFLGRHTEIGPIEEETAVLGPAAAK